MTMTAEARLAEMLDEKDAEIEGLEEKLREATDTGWYCHRKVEDVPELPLPRLEFAWNVGEGTEREYTVEYRLVRKHLVGDVVIVPLGLTRVSGGNTDSKPWQGPIQFPVNLPFRDGAHAFSDSAHLRLPLYAITPEGSVRLDTNPSYAANYGSQRSSGESHRRT